MQPVVLGSGEDVLALIDVLAAAGGCEGVLIVLGRVGRVPADISACAHVERVRAEIRDQVHAWLQVRDEIALGSRRRREDVVVIGLVELQARVQEKLLNAHAKRIEQRTVRKRY